MHSWISDQSELVDWCRAATCVPYGHLLIDLSPPTDDRLRYFTNTGSIPSKFYIPHRLKQSKFFDDENRKSPYFPRFAIIFPQMQKSFPSILPERLYQVPQRLYSKSSRSKLAKHKRISRDKISIPNLIALSKKIYLEAKRRRSGIRKGVATHKKVYPSRH